MVLMVGMQYTWLSEQIQMMDRRIARGTWGQVASYRILITAQYYMPSHLSGVRV